MVRLKRAPRRPVGTMTVRVRLALGLSGLAAVVALVSVVGLVALAATSSSFEAAQQDVREGAVPLAELKTDVLLAEEPGSSSVLTGSRRASEEFAALRLDVTGAFDELLAGDLSEERPDVQQAKRAWAGAVDARRRVVRQGGADPLVLVDRLRPFREGVVAAATSLETARTIAFRDFEDEFERSRATRQQAHRVLLTLLVVALGLALLTRRWVLSGVLRPVEDLVAAARRLERGDLAARAPLQGPDELQSVARSLNDMASQLERSHRELSHKALHDGLTGLANRALFLDRVGLAVAMARRAPGKPSVFLIDLDGFGRVNDTAGHAAGDTVLVEVAVRLRQIVGEGDTLARLGGDEFAILVPGGAGDDMAMKIITALRLAFPLPSGEVFLTPSIGVAHLASLEEKPGELLRRADLAVEEAKRRGGRTWCTYDSDLDRAAAARVRVEGELHRALGAGELVVHYQPVVDLVAGTVKGVEALVRWNHRRAGMVAPDRFLSVAEQTGLLVPIGWHVLRTAARDAVHWAREDPALEALSVNVNLAAKHLQDATLVPRTREVLQETGLQPARLVYEITETAMMEDAEVARHRLAELRRLGVRVAIDDFGTGYSSLAYLATLAVDVLKIDKSFVDPLATGDPSTLLETIVGLGHNLGLVTVAEGIERSEQADALRAMGCRLGQGYLWSRAVPASALPEVAARLGDPERGVRALT